MCCCRGEAVAQLTCRLPVGMVVLRTMSDCFCEAMRHSLSSGVKMLIFGDVPSVLMYVNDLLSGCCLPVGLLS